jgi:hypothetical protein
MNFDAEGKQYITKDREQKIKKKLSKKGTMTKEQIDEWILEKFNVLDYAKMKPKTSSQFDKGVSSGKIEKSEEIKNHKINEDDFELGKRVKDKLSDDDCE